MTDETANLVLEQLRLIRKSVGNIEADVQDLKIRMTAVEEHVGQVQVQLAGLNRRMDRFDERLTRIERRLELIAA